MIVSIILESKGIFNISILANPKSWVKEWKLGVRSRDDKRTGALDSLHKPSSLNWT